MLSNILNIILILSVTAVASAEVNALKEFFEKVGEVYYFFGKEKVTWYEAFANCRLVGGFLASIDGPSEATILSNHLDVNHEREVWWLSGADFHKKGDFYWYGTGRALSHFTWYPNALGDYNYAENCACFRYQDVRFGMENEGCNGTSQYICEFEKPKTVVNGKLEETNVPFDKVGEKFYYLSNKMRSWHKAFLHCRSMGSNLASISGAYEMKELSAHLVKKNISPKQWWLSGAKFNKDSDFVWYGTGKKLDYSNWSEFLCSELKNPNRCVQLWDEDSDYKMTVHPCNVKLNYICEITKTN